MIAGADPLAMVAVGGMDGVVKEATLFAGRYGRSRPIFALATTGGAAKR